MRLQRSLCAFRAYFAGIASAGRSAIHQAKIKARRASFGRERPTQRDDRAAEGMPPDQRRRSPFGCDSPGSRAGSRRVLSRLVSPAVLRAASRVSDDFATDHSALRLAGRHLATSTVRLAFHRRRNHTHLPRAGRRRQPRCAMLLAWPGLMFTRKAAHRSVVRQLGAVGDLRG